MYGKKKKIIFMNVENGLKTKQNGNQQKHMLKRRGVNFIF